MITGPFKSKRLTEKSNDKAMRLYLKEVSKIPLLTVEEEKELGRRIQKGDRDALQKLTEANLRFVIKIAKKYRNSGIPLLDLINQGNLGLMEAARRFDPDRNVRFTSYAVWWIRQSILQYSSQASYAFRISPRAANILYRVGTALSKKRNETSGSPSREVLAAEIGVSLNELNTSLAATAGTFSLDHPIDDAGDMFLGDRLEQTLIPSAEETVTNHNLAYSVEKSLELLSPMESRVLRLRFGLDDDEPMTLKEIGDMVNLSRERIRQIEAQALQKLRKSSDADSLATYLN
jgi:RNA polymerase primary sigma factor